MLNAQSKYQQVHHLHSKRKLADNIFDKYSRWSAQDVSDPDGFPSAREVMDDLESLQYLYKSILKARHDEAYSEGFEEGYDEGVRDARDGKC